MRRLAEVRNVAVLLAAAVVLVAAPVAWGAQMGTAFSYQGELDDGGTLVTGDCDFEFSLWDDPSAGTQLGSTIATTLSLVDGRFTAMLNDTGQFGPDACNGEARWLQIDVCCPTGCSPLTALTPRQELTPSPYALALPVVFPDTTTGSVGIGTLDPLNALHVHRTTGNCGVRISGDGDTNDTKIHFVSNHDASSLADASVGFDSDDGILRLVTGPAFGGSTNGLTVDSAGDVGIGTSTPANALHVHRTTGNCGVRISGDDNANDTILHFVSNQDASSLADASVGFDSSDGVLRLVTGPSFGGSTNGIMVDSAGDVGIGVTNPNDKLDVSGIVHSISGGFRFPDGTVQTTAATGGGPLWSENGSDIYYNSGDVGIGHSSPAAALDVRTTTESRAIYGRSDGSSGIRYGVVGEANINSTANSIGYGVYGFADCDDSVGSSADGYGGRFGAVADDRAYGVLAEAATDSPTGRAYGVYASAFGVAAGTAYAGYFSGDVTVTGTLSKGGGSFKIDHPLDPQNKYLSHSFVESPDMMNVYNGNVVLDEAGEAVVTMPEWFEVLNRDFRYQLTPIGAPGPYLYVAEEMRGNQFKIAGGEPGTKVSWQVTGIRQDAFANAHRIPVEEGKPGRERGLYLHPEVHGVDRELGVNYEHERQAELERAEREAEPELTDADPVAGEEE